MHHANTLKEKTKLYINILWPILITQISLISMNVIDTIMSGRVGTYDLAGVAIGASLWMPAFTLIIGILLSITPIVAQHSGRGALDKIAPAVTQSLYLSVILSLALICFGALFLIDILAIMNLEPTVQHIAYHYLIGLAFGIVPLYLSNVLRNFFDGQGFTRLTMLVTVLALPFNIIFNYALIFGKFGAPALGGIGAGYATAITWWVMFIFSAIITLYLPTIRKYNILRHWSWPSISAWREQLAIGVPIGMSIFFEASLFSVVTLVIGYLYTSSIIAANQVVLSFTSLIFMVPLSISMALTIVVGYSVGGEKWQNARSYVRIGVLTSIGFSFLSATFLFFFRGNVASWYSTDPEVVAFASKLFIMAMIFQLSDSLQASLQGALRGYKDVKVAFFITFIAYWVIGLPSGYLLAAYTDLQAYGLWLGIIIGLSIAALSFYLRLRKIARNN